MAKNEAFATLIEELTAGKSTREVADQTAVSHSTVAEMKNGRVPSFKLVARFLDGLAVPTAKREEVLKAAFGPEAAEKVAPPFPSVSNREDAEEIQRVVEIFGRQLADRLAGRVDRRESPTDLYERKIGRFYLKYSGEGYTIPSGVRYASGGEWKTPEEANAAVRDWLEVLRDMNPGKPVPELESWEDDPDSA